MTTPTVEEAIEHRRQAVNTAIPEELPIIEPTRLWNASRYLLDAGGKRLRPTLLLLVGEAIADVEPGSTSYREFPTLNNQTIDLLTAAVSIEIIQSFTLIHDDIMDDDSYRRGVETVHEAYDLETAILAGDTLYAKSFEIALNSGAPAERSLAAIRLLTETCTGICEGQTYDIEFEDRTDVTIDEYLSMIEQKTAILYAAAASLPAILLGVEDDLRNDLYQFGLDIGRAFQIKDDLLDFTADTDTLGKDQGSDLFEGKQTIVTIHAREQGVSLDELQAAGSLADAVDILEEVGSLTYGQQLARDYVESAYSQLNGLPDNQARSLLAELADYVVQREY